MQTHELREAADRAAELAVKIADVNPPKMVAEMLDALRLEVRAGFQALQEELHRREGRTHRG